MKIAVIQYSFLVNDNISVDELQDCITEQGLYYGILENEEIDAKFLKTNVQTIDVEFKECIKTDYCEKYREK